MKYQLVIFDMDGTLTEELLDFAQIRRDIGLPADGGILEHLRAMPAEARRVAKEILDRHELDSAARCDAKPGASELLAALRERGIRTALLTRNSSACATIILGRHRLELDHIATREDEPHKPHADSILNITRRLGIDPKQTLMVGDYLYDLQAAQAAGTDSALLCVAGAERPAFAAMATRCIEHLSEVLEMVEAV